MQDSLQIIRSFSPRRQCGSEHLPRPLFLAAQATEAPSPPDPHLVASEEQCAHPEIPAHHGASIGSSLFTCRKIAVA